jgi:hypothetical protein
MRLNSVLVLDVIFWAAILIYSSGNCSSRSSGTAQAQSKERLMLRWVRDIASSFEALAVSGDRFWGAGIGLLADSTDGGRTWTVHEVITEGDDRTISRRPWR